MKKTIIFDFYKTIYNPYQNKLFKGIYPLLKKLAKSYQLILLTTRSKNRKKQIEKFRLKEIFETIIICQSKTIKIFKKITQGKQAIIIGDNPQEEIYFAKKLKIPVIKINSERENPVKTIKSSKLIKL